jgi:PAS domain S-box-containing protein
MVSDNNPDQTQSMAPRVKNRSIALLLTTSIILTVACVSAISIFIGYMDATKKARNDLEKSVERNIAAIADILQVPLWTYDQETIEDIGNLYAGNDDIVYLTIIDSLGKQLFRTEKSESDKPVVKTREVRFEGRVAGTVEMGLSSRKYREAIRQLLWSGIITMVINLSVLILITGFLLRLFLKNPLDILSSIVSSYASGNYDNPGIQLPYIEFQPIVDVIRSMGRKILIQIGELRQAEQKYRGIFENAVEGIFQTSTHGEFLNANPSMARILGYDSPVELMGSVTRVAQQCFASMEEFRKVIDELKKSNVISGCEVRGLKKSGETLWISISARTVRNQEGDILYFEGSIFDISDRKEKEEAEKRQKAADAASQAKTLFIARMSHELRTPLNSVLGMTEMLADTHPSPDQLEYIKLLQTSGEFLESIINDILDFSKIEAQQLVLDEIPFDLFKTVEDVAALVNVRAREKNLPVTFSIEPGIHRILSGDPVRLKQILINLGGNAVKFTKEGHVKIEVARNPGAGPSKTQENIVFRVRDTGIGIPESKQGVIFDSFTQADSFIKRQYGGTGLGLSICKRLVELMGGTLDVESIEGEGSTFFFNLSLKKEAESSVTEKKNHLDNEENLPPLTILLADDIEPNRTVVHRYLKKAPVTIVDAGNGLEAYEAYKKGRFDLVLMDVEMPVMNGLEATRKIRIWEKENNLAPSPLIILSAHAFGEQRKQCYDAGCNNLLVKPIRKTDLVQAISQIIIKDPASPETSAPPVAMVEKKPEEPRVAEGETEKVYIDVMFEDLLKGFFDYFEESLAAMNTAVDEKDFESLYRLGHGLKGSARNYEFFQLGNIFFEIEKAAADKNLDDALHHMRRAKKYLETVEVEFIEKD